MSNRRIPRVLLMNSALLPPREILIAEDHADTRETHALLLRLNGCNVHTAENGTEAVKLARLNPPDIAFIDLGMPKCDGFECAAQFRAEPTLNRTVIVAISGFGDDDAIQQASDVGFDYFACKPVEPELLYACTFGVRQDELVLCSEALQLKCARLRVTSKALSSRSIAARKRAREIVTDMFVRYHKRL
jgi:CheY-like chemotaxis protein